MNRNIQLLSKIIFVLLILQSCTAFRTHIDNTCAAQFINEYPSPQKSSFILPWKVTEKYTLTQGNCTLESHNIAEKQHMSFDFKMPIGTAVVAMAGGRIIAVIENFKDNKDNGINQANLIGIEHDGGVLTWYAHLMHEGVKVNVDDKVLQGDVIGYSGNTGNSAYPHLHIYAQQLTDECHDAINHTAKLELCPVIPISFLNASPNDTILKEWQTYFAEPY
ncbi:MAG: M23 family metallopeptidase [Alcanivoracaceae bacterium]|nr:M23 family metallopeptidase [Alcanivoracaceae bacterium]